MPTRPNLTIGRVLTGGLILVSPLLVVSHAYSVDLPPYSGVAVVSPDVETPVNLLDGVTLNTAIWTNFQRVVAECMWDQDWYYDQPPVPSWWVATYDDNGDPLTSEPAYRDPDPVNLYPENNPAHRYPRYEYLEALRGEGFVGSGAAKDFIAHDGINSPHYGSMPADTGGCEAIARQAVTVPSIQAKDELLTQVASELSNDTELAEVTDLDDLAESLADLPQSEQDQLVSGNEELVDQAGGKR